MSDVPGNIRTSGLSGPSHLRQDSRQDNKTGAGASGTLVTAHGKKLNVRTLSGALSGLDGQSSSLDGHFDKGFDELRLSDIINRHSRNSGMSETTFEGPRGAISRTSSFRMRMDSLGSEKSEECMNFDDVGGINLGQNTPKTTKTFGQRMLNRLRNLKEGVRSLLSWKVTRQPEREVEAQDNEGSRQSVRRSELAVSPETDKGPPPVLPKLTHEEWNQIREYNEYLKDGSQEDGVPPPVLPRLDKAVWDQIRAYNKHYSFDDQDDDAVTNGGSGNFSSGSGQNKELGSASFEFEGRDSSRVSGTDDREAPGASGEGMGRFIFE